MLTLSILSNILIHVATLYGQYLIEYCSCVWNTGFVQYLKVLENIQRRNVLRDWVSWLTGNDWESWNSIPYKGDYYVLTLFSTIFLCTSGIKDSVSQRAARRVEKQSSMPRVHKKFYCMADPRPLKIQAFKQPHSSCVLDNYNVIDLRSEASTNSSMNSHSPLKQPCRMTSGSAETEASCTKNNYLGKTQI